MLVTFRVEDTFTYVAFVGAAWETGEITSFHGEMHKRLKEGARCFLWDVQGLQRVDINTFGVFVSTVKRVRDYGGCVVLHAASAEVKQMLVAIKLAQVVKVFRTEAEARKAVGAPPVETP